MMPLSEMTREYDRWYTTPYGRYADVLEKKLVFKFLDLRRVGYVLDVGCGTGNYSISLATLGLNVIGVDLSVQMLKMAKEKAKIHRLDIEFVGGDAEYLPFKDSAFDTAISILVVCFLKNDSQAIDEMRRVSRTGGKIIIGTLNKWSLYGIEKKLAAKFKKSVYGNARFHSILELRNISGYWWWSSTLFALPWMPLWLLKILGHIEKALSDILKPFGAFVVVGFVNSRASN